MPSMLEHLKTVYKYLKHGPPKSIFVNPIEDRNIKSIKIEIGRQWLSENKGIRFLGEVTFDNDKTRLYQKFDEDTFMNLLKSIDEFVVNNEVAQVLMKDDMGGK